MKIKYGILLSIVLLGMMGKTTKAQTKLTLNDAIRIAQERSYDAMSAKFSFMSSYWTYRSFKAELLPSLGLSGNLGNYNRSISEVKDTLGMIHFVDDNSMSNSLNLYLNQNILATGGTISLESYLYRLDQFNYDSKTYNSQPIRIRYNQPLMAYNELKWYKKTAPLEYLQAQKSYLDKMEQIKIATTELFFSVLAAQSDYEQTRSSSEDNTTLYEMAKKRFEIGTKTKNEILEMELNQLNSQVSINDKKLAFENSLYRLFSYLRMKDYKGVELVPPYTIPNILINSDEVLKKAMDNTSYSQDQQLTILNAQKNLARNKSLKGLQMSLSSELGFTQTSGKLSGAYSNLKDNEIIGLSLSLPIFDWGNSKGKVKMAEAQLEMAKIQVEQNQEELHQNVNQMVMEFNSMAVQCKNALRAQDIAEERYEISKKLFEAGSLTVLELNSAQSQRENAQSQYINQLRSFWVDYFKLQKATLYDWEMKRDLEVDFDKLIK